MVNVGVQAIAANLLPPPDGGVDSIAALQQVLKDWIAKSPVSSKYGLIIGFGYDDSQLKEKRHPTKEELDMVSKDVPIMCFHQSGHIRSYNSKALEIAGITSQTKDPVGGVIQRKAGSQEPNGVFEESAMLLVDTKILPKVGTEEMFNLAMAGQELYKRFGHTTGQEGLAIAPFLLGLTEMANRKNSISMWLPTRPSCSLVLKKRCKARLSVKSIKITYVSVESNWYWMVHHRVKLHG
jgi:predicted amidohydrolase YtcJ